MKNFVVCSPEQFDTKHLAHIHGMPIIQEKWCFSPGDTVKYLLAPIKVANRLGSELHLYVKIKYG